MSYAYTVKSALSWLFSLFLCWCFLSILTYCYPARVQSATRRVRRPGAGRNCGTIIAAQLRRSRHHECELNSNAPRGFVVLKNRKGGSVSCLVIPDQTLRPASSFGGPLSSVFFEQFLVPGVFKPREIIALFR